MIARTVHAHAHARAFPTAWADHPRAALLADYYAVLVDEKADAYAKSSAAEKAGALILPREKDASILRWIAYREDRDGVRDPAFWEAVGGRPEHYAPALGAC